MSIRVNIANQVRQTTVLAWRPLLPLFEAVMNSFQAIKEAKLPSSIPGRVQIEVVRDDRQLDLDVPPISGFRIIDNGIGLDDSNYDSFNTAFSAHKLSRGERGWGVLLGSKHSSTRASRALSRTTTDFTPVHSFSMKTTTSTISAAFQNLPR
jgi:hypothetical protein